MAALNLEHMVNEFEAVESPCPIRIAADDDVPISSPALALHKLLEHSISASHPEPHTKKWPRAARLAFLAGATISIWGGLIMGTRALLHS